MQEFLGYSKKADDLTDSEQSFDGDGSAYDFDWFVQFYEHASCVSSEEMQKLWASILAREVGNPGTTSVSLLHALSMMNREQAMFFCNVSRFAMLDLNYGPNLLLFVSKNRIAYEESKITPKRLKELERLGLLECDFKDEYVFRDEKSFRTGNRLIRVYGDPENQNKILAGNVTFTRDGEILYSVIDKSYKQYRADICDFTVTKFISRNCRVIINDREV